MKTGALSVRRFGRAGLVLAGCLVTAHWVWAGEPIVYSSSQANLARIASEDPEAKLLKSLPSLPSTSPFDSLGIAPAPDRSRSSAGQRGKRDKKSDPEAQKWNWDELQDEETEASSWETWKFDVESDTAGNTGVGSRFRDINSTAAVERNQERHQSRTPSHLLSSRQRQKAEERSERSKARGGDGEVVEAEPGTKQQGLGIGVQVGLTDTTSRQQDSGGYLVSRERSAGRVAERDEEEARWASGRAGEKGKTTDLESLGAEFEGVDFTHSLGGLVEHVDLRPDLSVGRLGPVLPDLSKRSTDSRTAADSGLGFNPGLPSLPQTFNRPSALGQGSRLDPIGPRPAWSSPASPTSRGPGDNMLEVPRRGGVLGR